MPKWTAAILHATHNLYIQGFFDAVTVDTGYTKWISTEFGIGLALVIAGFAYFYYRRRDELDSLPEPVSLEYQRQA